MSKEFNLSQYMSEGIENIVKNVLKSSIKNPRETTLGIVNNEFHIILFYQKHFYN